MKNLHNALLLKQLYQLKTMGFRYTDVKPFSYEKVEKLVLPNTIKALRKQALSCHLCFLSKNRTHVIFGEGNTNAELMFIGDFPTEQDDTEGKMFLGQAGEMLSAMIEKVLNLSREEVYITNLLKCHPLSNQESEKTTIDICKAYLFKEIELIQPKIIVTLGEKAYQTLTNDNSSLKEIRGNIIKQNKYKLIPTYHPAFLLKNPSLKKEVFLDLQKIKKMKN